MKKLYQRENEPIFFMLSSNKYCCYFSPVNAMVAMSYDTDSSVLSFLFFLFISYKKWNVEEIVSQNMFQSRKTQKRKANEQKNHHNDREMKETKATTKINKYIKKMYAKFIEKCLGYSFFFYLLLFLVLHE